MDIAKLSNNRLKELALLKQKKHRLSQQQVVVEGSRTLRQIRDYGILPLEQYLVSGGQALWEGVPAYHLSEADLGRICDSEHPQGVAALLPLPQPGLAEFQTALYLDGISDPGNMGSIFRVAAAFAIDAILLSPDCVEVSSPKVIRASLGSVYHIPFMPMDPAKLRSTKARITATDLRSGTPLHTFKPTTVEKMVIVIGSEAHGISAQIREIATDSIYIRMSGEMESLNAAIAAAIIAHHLYAGKAL